MNVKEKRFFLILKNKECYNYKQGHLLPVQVVSKSYNVKRKYETLESLILWLCFSLIIK